MSLKIKIGNETIASYKRLAYTPWHAIAEMIDNSTQSYSNNKDVLDEIAQTTPTLEVIIDYNNDDDLLRVTDNAMGMSYKELEEALMIAHPPANTSGRSKYGMGLKTSASWLGNYWTVRTKKLGETKEHFITVDVEKVASGDSDLDYQVKSGADKMAHYTIVEIHKLNRKFKGRTLGKIERFLSSMYRQDFRKKSLLLVWRGKELSWEELDDRLLVDVEGKKYKRDFNFYIDPDGEEQKYVHGWVGVLKDGSRSNAGFSVLHSDRVVKGWPDSWRPETLYGQEQGSNNLVNQRLVGEIHLDDFDVSHTKDDILWLGDQEDLVQNELLEACGEFKVVASTYRKEKDISKGPLDVETSTALNELQKELESKELKDILSTNPMLSEQLIEDVVQSVRDRVITTYQEKYKVQIIEGLTVKVYLEPSLSINDQYLTIDSASPDEVIIIINSAHPHWNQLDGSSGVLNYLRHCTYDGIAEWQARKFVRNLLPDTIKVLKDRLLRLPYEIERGQSINSE